MSEDKFEWTDELVAKYGEYYKSKQGVDFTTWGKDILESFKKEHYNKVPLFTTEDGVDYKEGWKYGILNTFNWTFCTKVADKNTYPSQPPFLYFSTKDAMNDYIYKNKPIEVSYKEIEQLLLKEYFTETSFTEILNFFKSKIKI